MAHRWAVARADVGAGPHAFNDVLALPACVGAGRPIARSQRLATLQAAAAQDSDNGGFTHDVGLPLGEGLLAQHLAQRLPVGAGD